MLAAEGLRQVVSESETRAESCPACALQAPTAPSAAGGEASVGSGARVDTSGCQSHPDGCVIAHRHLHAVPTQIQWITSIGTGFLPKLSRKQGSTGIVFKSAWHVNLSMHKTRQLLGGFTMHYIFCHRVYTYIYCKLVLERRDASTCGKPTQNIPSAPTFSIHDYAAVMQRKIETHKLLWKFKLSFVIQWQETTV